MIQLTPPQIPQRLLEIFLRQYRRLLFSIEHFPHDPNIGCPLQSKFVSDTLEYLSDTVIQAKQDWSLFVAISYACYDGECALTGGIIECREADFAVLLRWIIAALLYRVYSRRHGDYLQTEEGLASCVL